jgi:hypothetical protein
VRGLLQRGFAGHKIKIQPSLFVASENVRFS